MQGHKFLLVLAVGLVAALVCRSGEAIPRRDGDGEPLPPGVLARLGSARFRPGASLTNMAVSPDGQLLAAVYIPNGYCDLWNTATGKRARRIDLHLSGSYWDSRLAFADRGATLLVLTADKTIKAQWFDVATGKQRRNLELRSCRPPMAVAPRAGLAALAGPDRTVRIVNLANGVELCRWEVKGRGAFGLDFSPDGRQLAVCDLTNSVRIHDTSTGRRIRTLKRDRFPVMRLLYSRNGQALVTKINDRDDHEHTGAVSVWDPATGKERCRLRGSVWYGIPLAISADGKMVATGGEGNDVELWDSATGRKLHQLQTRALPMQACFFPDGKTVAVSSNAGTITLWDVNTGKLLPISPDPVTMVNKVWFSADGRQVIGSAERLMAWNAANGRLVREYPASSAAPFTYALSSDGSLSASAGREHDHPVIDLWDTRSGKKVRTLRPSGDEPMLALRFTPDGRRLVSGGGDEAVRVWDVATGRIVYTLKGHGAVVNRLAVSLDGRWLASASDRGRADPDVRLWDLSNGREARHFHPRFAWASALAFSSDGRYLAVGGEAPHGGERSVVEVWETATGKEWRVFAGPKGGIRCVAWSPDDRMLAVGDRGMAEIGANDHSVRLWELATGQERRRLTEQEVISSVAFSPEGGRLAIASADTPVLVYDLLDTQAAPPLTEAMLETCWTGLADKDAHAAWRTMLRLIHEPERTVPFLRSRLRPVQAPDDKAIGRLITGLDNRRFATRTKAYAELEKLGRLAEPALRRALANQPSAEARTRIQRLLRGLDHSASEELRGLRAIEVLEHIGTANARAVLSSLAKGSPQATLTLAARRVSEQLRGRSR